jgi:hydrogenase nickel incorporation protein HypA/HybF
MHEAGLMRDAIDLAIAEAARAGAGCVHRVVLRVGALAGVEPEALDFAFEVAAAGTIAAGARLEIQQTPAVCFCPACGRDFDPAGVVFECPRCGAISGDVRGGCELELVSLEVS